MPDNGLYEVQYRTRRSQVGENSSMRTTLGEYNKVVDVYVCHPSSSRIDMYLAARSDAVYANLLLGWDHEYFLLNVTAVWTSDLATNRPPSSLQPHLSVGVALLRYSLTEPGRVLRLRCPLLRVTYLKITVRISREQQKLGSKVLVSFISTRGQRSPTSP